MKAKDDSWHKEVITREVENTIKNLRRKDVLSKFYLAGGTAIALQFGHRKSIDLDFFSQLPFNEEELLQQLIGIRGLSVISRMKETLHVHVKGTKVSFLGYSYKLLFPLKSFLGINIADPRDIACMKISAISSRGTKRDFIDLYIAAKSYGLAELMKLFKQKFSEASYSTVHILKSLTYFDNAEKDPMPDMVIKVSWDEIKQFFSNEAPKLM